MISVTPARRALVTRSMATPTAIRHAKFTFSGVIGDCASRRGITESTSDPFQLRSDRSAATPNPGQNADAVGSEDVAPFGHGMILNVVEDQVVAFRAFGEILLRVVDDVIGPQRARHVHVARAYDCSDFGLERLRDLHCECPDAAGCAINQDFLAAVNLPRA